MLSDDDKAWLKEWAAEQWLKGRFFLLGFNCCFLAVSIGGFMAFYAFAEQWRHEWRQQAPRRVTAGQGVGSEAIAEAAR